MLVVILLRERGIGTFSNSSGCSVTKNKELRGIKLCNNGSQKAPLLRVLQHRDVDGATIVVLVHIKIIIGDSLLLFIQLLIDLVLSSEMSDVGQHNDASDMEDFGPGMMKKKTRRNKRSVD